MRLKVVIRPTRKVGMTHFQVENRQNIAQKVVTYPEYAKQALIKALSGLFHTFTIVARQTCDNIPQSRRSRFETANKCRSQKFGSTSQTQPPLESKKTLFTRFLEICHLMPPELSPVLRPWWKRASYFIVEWFYEMNVSKTSPAGNSYPRARKTAFS